jgi:CelD/BcsL family acetyltransferase involved in cellulose biosynthesis
MEAPAFGADNAAVQPRFHPIVSRTETPLRVERVPGPEAFAALVAEWDQLDARISPRTPFTSPLWNMLWWKHYRSMRLFVRDDLFVHVVRDRLGKLIAVAPMMMTHRPSVGPVRVRVLQFFGADVNVTELRGLVCHPDDQSDVISALIAHFSGGPTGWDWIDWGAVRDDGTAREALLRLDVIGWERQNPSYHLPLAPSWEEFRSRLSRNIKQSLRKCYNSLKRAEHPFVFRAVQDPLETPAALQTFFRLHSERGRALEAVKHHDVFAAPRDRAFLTEYAQAMAARGQLRIFQIEIEGHVVAARMGFVLGDELYLYYSGYDTRWAKYSVMTTVVAEAIKWAIANGLKIVHLSTGQDVSKLRWGPKETIFRSALQVSPSRRSRLAFRTYQDVLRLGRPESQLSKLLTLVRR